VGEVRIHTIIHDSKGIAHGVHSQFGSGSVQSAIRVGAERGIQVAAAVVDAGGRLLASARSENAGFVNLTIAERKAVAGSISRRRPTAFST